MGNGNCWEWERAIADCAMALMSIRTAHEGMSILQNCLKTLGYSVDATRVVLFQLGPDNEYGDARVEWHATDRSSKQGARYKQSELPETFRVFNQGDTVTASADMPHPYSGLQATMLSEELAAVIITPICEKGRTTWATVFSWHGSRTELSDAQVQFCHRATQLLASGLTQQQQFLDIVRREDKLVHSQRLESLGLLAGGIAHDFSNVLQAVLGLTEILKRSGGDPDIANELINVANRAGKITRRLLVFSRQESREQNSIGVGEALREALSFLQHSIPEDRQLELVNDAPNARVLVSSSDLEHAIINLCTNASAAMPEGGNIQLGCRLASDDSSVVLWVKDNGVGMEAEQLAQARVPFFTTKPAGEGTGLGLAMVDSIMQRSSGRLEIESEPDKGTTVSLHFPITDLAYKSRATPPQQKITGNETILVAEDDPVLLRVTSSQLEKAGFHVIQATGGREALEHYLQHASEIKIVVSDVIMPGGGAAELHSAICKTAPTLPFLFTTGYDAGALSKTILDQPNCLRLQKPFSANSLLTLVRQLLDA